MRIGRDTAHMFGLFLAIVAVVVALDARQTARLDRIDAGLAATNERLSAVEAGLAALEAGLAALRDRVAGVEAGQAALEEGHARTNEHVARIEGTVAGALGRSFPAPAPEGAGAVAE